MEEQGNPMEYLEFNIYPPLNQALLQLTEHLLKSDEIRRHKERLKEQRILDKMEQKKIEKIKLKEELGSDYESSDDSINEEYQEIQKRKKKQTDQDSEESEKNDNDQQKFNQDDDLEDNIKMVSVKENKYSQNLEQIQENIEEFNDEELNDTYENEKRKMQDYLEKKSRIFNPLRFLAEQLQQQQKKKPSNKDLQQELINHLQ